MSKVEYATKDDEVPDTKPFDYLDFQAAAGTWGLDLSPEAIFQRVETDAATRADYVKYNPSELTQWRGRLAIAS